MKYQFVIILRTKRQVLFKAVYTQKETEQTETSNYITKRNGTDRNEQLYYYSSLKVLVVSLNS